GTDKRKLLELPAPELTGAKLAMASVGDPGAPLALETIVQKVAPEGSQPKAPVVRKAILVLGAIVGAAVLLALLWTHTPLADWVTRDNATRLAEWFAAHWWAPLIVV